MKLATAVSKFLLSRRMRGCNAGTLRGYESQLGLFASWLVHRRVHELAHLSARHLADYIESLKRRPKLQAHRAGTLSAVTIHKRSKALRTFLLWCEGQGLLAEPLARHVPIPAKPKRLPKALQSHEARLLLTAEMSALDRAAVSLMLDTGARLGEVCAFDCADVDLTERVALIRHGKGDKTRIVVFSVECGAELRLWLDERDTHKGRDSPALFLNQYGKRLSADALYRRVKAVGRQVGLEHARPHVLRHSYATGALNGGASIVDIAEQLGHEDVNTTMIYLHLSTDGRRERHDAHSPLKRARGHSPTRG